VTLGPAEDVRFSGCCQLLEMVAHVLLTHAGFAVDAYGRSIAFTV
jgi:hypothetical protein